MVHSARLKTIKSTKSVRHCIIKKELSALLSEDGLIIMVVITINTKTNIRKKNHGKDKNFRRMLTERVTLQIAVRRKKTYSMNSSMMTKRRSPQMAVLRRRASN